MNTKPIHKIKSLFETGHINESIIEELRTDKRKGVQRLVAIYDKQKQREKELEKDFFVKCEFDKQFYTHDYDLLAGVDEAGRGPLAGPVFAAAVILPTDFTYIGLNDSKQLTEIERNALFHAITHRAISYSISVIPVHEIDRINIFEATKQAMRNALMDLKKQPQIALIDAVKLEGLPFPTKEIIKGDQKSVAIAAASILAKVTRDQLMVELDEQFPMYDFKNNKGYGTKSHLFALRKYGPTIHHRKSFSPVQKVIENIEEGSNL